MLLLPGGRTVFWVLWCLLLFLIGLWQWQQWKGRSKSITIKNESSSLMTEGATEESGTPHWEGVRVETGATTGSDLVTVMVTVHVMTWNRSVHKTRESKVAGMCCLNTTWRTEKGILIYAKIGEILTSPTTLCSKDQKEDGTDWPVHYSRAQLAGALGQVRFETNARSGIITSQVTKSSTRWGTRTSTVVATHSVASENPLKDDESD